MFNAEKEDSLMLSKKRIELSGRLKIISKAANGAVKITCYYMHKEFFQGFVESFSILV